MSERDSSLRQLTSVRFKEFIREPEALFWSLGFPILLAIGLGIAFRSRPAEIVHVAVVEERCLHDDNRHSASRRSFARR
jgi:hypothetical protein